MDGEAKLEHQARHTPFVSFVAPRGLVCMDVQASANLGNGCIDFTPGITTVCQLARKESTSPKRCLVAIAAFLYAPSLALYDGSEAKRWVAGAPWQIQTLVRSLPMQGST